MSDYNQYITAVNKIFDYLEKMKTDNEDFKQKYKKYKGLYILP